MSDADVAYLRTRPPFRDLDPDKFPRSTPLEGVLKNDTRLRRVEPGEIIIREGDYGNSAFLVLAGSVTVIAKPTAAVRPDIAPQSRGEKTSTLLTLKRFFTRSAYPESRRPDQIVPVPHSTQTGTEVLTTVDDRPTLILQDFDAVIGRDGTATLGPGDFFGEVAAMYRTPHAATVVAGTEATILEIRWQGLRLMRGDPKFNATLDEQYRRGWLPIHLRETRILRYLDDESISRVADATHLRSYGRLEWYADFRKSTRKSIAQQIEDEPVVAREGTFATELLIVRSGFGRVSSDHGASARTSAYIGKGHWFGLEESARNCIADDQPLTTLQSTLRAVGMLDVLAIPVEVFAEIVLPRVRRSDWPESIQQFIAQRDRRTGRVRSDRRDATTSQTTDTTTELTGQSFASTSLMEFVIDHRLTNGNQAMVIDLNRCTRCDDCVKACASTHDGNPRFIRGGPKHDHLQFASACMHCTDPVCMIGCPTGSIARDSFDGLVQIDETICVGCGTCASACPYNNISMANIVDPSGRPYLDSDASKPIRKATKCDMCRDVAGGPACVSACPHDALVRIDLSQTPPLSQWMQTRGGATS
jgi:Fe-S-cluster-containing dehydrogenase component/CRP-like cAMP-binding protein